MEPCWKFEPATIWSQRDRNWRWIFCFVLQTNSTIYKSNNIIVFFLPEFCIFEILYHDLKKKFKNQKKDFKFLGELLIIGGGSRYDKYKNYAVFTERCRYEDGQMRCTQQQPKLLQYSFYPELLVVPKNYCDSL